MILSITLLLFLKKECVGARGVFVGDFLKKVPHTPQKLPKQDIATHERKCGHSASFFYAFKGSFRAPVLQYRFWFVPLPLVDFFEASPYGV